METVLNSLLRSTLTFAGLYLFLIAFFLLAVSSGDDFGKIAVAEQLRAGSGNFIEQILGRYETTNGRVIGNSLHLLSSFSFILNAFARAAIVLGILWGVARVARVHSLAGLPVILLLILVPAVPILKQAILWSAGFYNYVVPVFFVLLIVVLLRDVTAKWKPAAILACAVAACLFMETVTVALVLVSAGLAIGAVARRRVSPGQVALIVGSFLGAAIMFASPAYRVILSGEDDYRPLPDHSEGLIGSVVGRITGNLADLSQHLVLDLALLYFAIAVVVALATRAHQSGGVTSGVMLGAAASILLVRAVGTSSLDGRIGVLAGLAVLILFAMFCLAAAVTLWGTKLPAMKIAAAWVLGGAGVAVPLLLVAPFGPRNFFLTAILFLVAGITVAAPWLNNLPQHRAQLTATLMVCCVVATTLLGVLAANKVIDVKNAGVAATAYRNGSEKIDLRRPPFPALVHDGENGKKYLLSLQYLECEDGDCQPLREVTIEFH